MLSPPALDVSFVIGEAASARKDNALKILYLHRTQADGVEGVHIGEIVTAMRRLGHHVEIVSPVGNRLGDGGLAAAPTPPTLKQRALRLVSRILPEWCFELLELSYSLLAIADVRRRFTPDDVDVIFERYAIFAFAGAHLARAWHKPFYLEVNYTCQSALVRRRSAILKPLARSVDRLVFRRATGLFPVSSVLKDHLVRDYAVAPEKIRVLPNAADPARFDPAKTAPVPGAGRAIGFVGGFYPWHGLDLLLAAFRQVAPEFPDTYLLLVGDGPMRATIERQALAVGLEQRVLLPGRAPHRELVSSLARFHVGVVPDSNDYGSPMKVFEYMAMAKPVIAPDYGPLRDALTDGEEGLLFRPGDAGDLARCLRTLLSDPASYERMASAARSRVVATHNWTANARVILQTIDPRPHT